MDIVIRGIFHKEPIHSRKNSTQVSVCLLRQGASLTLPQMSKSDIDFSIKQSISIYDSGTIKKLLTYINQVLL